MTDIISSPDSATMRSPFRAPLPKQPLRTNSRPFQPICF